MTVPSRIHTNTTYRFFVEKMGDAIASTFVGDEGELFFDPATGIIRLSDGMTPGGTIITSGVSGVFDPSLYYTRPAVDGLLASLIGTADTQSDTLGELQTKVDGKLGLAGGTVTGPIYYAGSPVGANELTNKTYVDAKVATSLTTALAALTTTQVPEGSNLYFTDARSDSRFAINIVSPAATPGLVRNVNGIAPDATGSLTLSLSTTITGDVASQPASADDGTLYVIVGDADANNDGRSFVWANTSGQWIELAPSDTATNDARYVNTSGDTMTGPLTLSADPTVPLGAATKQYVDSITHALDDLTDANTASAIAGQSLVYSGTEWVPSTPAANLGDLLDVSNSAPAVGAFLGWDAANSEWAPIVSSASPTLAGLVDTSVPTLADGDTLAYDANTSMWVARSAPEAKKHMLPDHGHGWGRSFVYDNNVYVAGSNATERVHGWGSTSDIYTTYTPPFIGKAPDEITKFLEGVGNQYIMGVKDGVSSLWARGDDDLGQLGNAGSPNGLPGNDSDVAFKRNEDPKVFGPGINVLNIWSQRFTWWESATQSIWVEVDDNGTRKLYAAGYNGNGVLGIGGQVNSGPLDQGLLSVFDGIGVKDIYVHSTSSMFIAADGTLYGAGYNVHGQAGITHIGSAAIEQSLKVGDVPIKDAEEVVVDWCNGVGVSAWYRASDGTVWASGDNNESGLGIGTAADVNRFNQVMLGATTPLTDIVKIWTPGRGQLFALTSTGDVYATGRNQDGVFGNPAFPEYTTPAQPYAFLIQSNVETLWTGTNSSGWCSAFWKFIGDDTICFSGMNRDYNGGVNPETNDANINYLAPVNTLGKKVVDIKRIGGVAESNSPFTGHLFLTEDESILIAGQAGTPCYMHALGSYIKSPVQIVDYPGASGEKTIIQQIETQETERDQFKLFGPLAPTGSHSTGYFVAEGETVKVNAFTDASGTSAPHGFAFLTRYNGNVRGYTNDNSADTVVDVPLGTATPSIGYSLSFTIQPDGELIINHTDSRWDMMVVVEGKVPSRGLTQTSLPNLQDVSASGAASPSSGDLLMYNGSVWTPTTPALVMGSTPGGLIQMLAYDIWAAPVSVVDASNASVVQGTNQTTVKVNVPFTPKSANSRITILIDAEFRITGSGSDEYNHGTALYDSTGALISSSRFVRQTSTNDSAEMGRSNVLMPLTSVFTNTGTDVKTYESLIQQNGGDDYFKIWNGIITITETAI